MLQMISLLSLGAMACVAQPQHCASEFCANDVGSAVKGSAMLQVRQSSMTEPSTMACSLQRAKDEPLTEEGFQTVSKSCCYEDLKTFMTRVIDDMGMKVCDYGGLSGIAPFYSCPPSPVTFQELKDELTKAMPSASAKCHWIANRYDECTDPAVECQVSAQRPPPAPEPVATGFIALQVDNPSEAVRTGMRTNDAADVVTEELSNSLGIDEDYVNVVIGSGTLDGEEATPAGGGLFLVPASQRFVETKGKTKMCKVFAVYSIQEKASTAGGLTTPPPTLDEKAITDKLKALDAATFGARLTQDLAVVDSAVGSIQVLETSICEKTSQKCTHEVVG